MTQGKGKFAGVMALLLAAGPTPVAMARSRYVAANTAASPAGGYVAANAAASPTVGYVAANTVASPAVASVWPGPAGAPVPAVSDAPTYGTPAPAYGGAAPRGPQVPPPSGPAFASPFDPRGSRPKGEPTPTPLRGVMPADTDYTRRALAAQLASRRTGMKVTRSLEGPTTPGFGPSTPDGAATAAAPGNSFLPSVPNPSGLPPSAPAPGGMFNPLEGPVAKGDDGSHPGAPLPPGVVLQQGPAAEDGASAGGRRLASFELGATESPTAIVEDSMMSPVGTNECDDFGPETRRLERAFWKTYLHHRRNPDATAATPDQAFRLAWAAARQSSGLKATAEVKRLAAFLSIRHQQLLDRVGASADGWSVADAVLDAICPPRTP